MATTTNYALLGEIVRDMVQETESDLVRLPVRPDGDDLDVRKHLSQLGHDVGGVNVADNLDLPSSPVQTNLNHTCGPLLFMSETNPRTTLQRQRTVKAEEEKL